MQHLPNGATLSGGRYKIVRFISAGGFGCTYEGIHTMMDTKVAIKEFFVKDFCNRDENTNIVTVATQSKLELIDRLRNKFIEEAKAIFQMKHDNIVRVLDIFEENGTAYYVMDYIDGISLQELVKQEGRLEEGRAKKYVLQIAEALQYVHGLNRLHLDIKPGNIMVNSQDNAILIDFGTSKQYDEADGENNSTLLGQTPGYAPIEQMGNDVHHFSPATDIYSLGATFYKIVTGKTPPLASALMTGDESLEFPRQISSSIEMCIRKAMNAKRSERHTSARAFIQSLQQTVSNDVSEETILEVSHKSQSESRTTESQQFSEQYIQKGTNSNKWKIVAIAACVIVVLGVCSLLYKNNEPKVDALVEPPVSEARQESTMEEPSSTAEEEKADIAALDSRKTEETIVGPTERLYPTGASGRCDQDHGVYYKASNLIDGSTKTCWALDIRGKSNYYPQGFGGVKVKLRCRRLDYIVLYNGYQKNDLTYTGNPRAKRIALYNTTDLSTPIIESSLDDTREGQVCYAIDNTSNLHVSEIAIFFPEDFYYPAKWNDLSISEIEFYGVK